MAHNKPAPIVSSVVITEVKDETPDSIIDNKLADYYKTLPSTTMKPLSFDIDDEDSTDNDGGSATGGGSNQPKLAVATAEISHQVPSSQQSSSLSSVATTSQTSNQQFRVMSSRYRSESRSSSYESSSTSTSTSSSGISSLSSTSGAVGLPGLGGILAPSLKLERINEAREMRVTQQVTSPIHLKVITSRNRIHMQHVRSISEFRSKM